MDDEKSKAVRKKRVQRYIRQLRQLVVEQVPSTNPERKLSTVDVLEKTIELLKSTETVENTSPSISPPHSWASTIPEDLIDSKIWIPNLDYSGQHLFSIWITLPDGTINDIRKVGRQEINLADCSFLEFIPDYCRQALLTSAYDFRVEKRKILTRLFGRGVYELLCEFKRPSQYERIATQIHVLEIQNAFGPTRGPNCPPNDFLARHTFGTRHTSSCLLTNIDPIAAYSIGYLPGEVLNRSILYLIHPDDFILMKEIHINLKRCRGEMIHERRLRWLTFNGTVAWTDSTWFAFWDPWSNKLDSVIGRHTFVEQSMGHPQVEIRNIDSTVQVADDSTINKIGLEIGNIADLDVVLDSRTSEMVIEQRDDSPNPQNLGAYIDGLIETLATKQSLLNIDSREQQRQHQQQSISNPNDLNNVVHFSDSLSYSQINCLENVHRLLRSQNQQQCSSSDMPSESRCPAEFDNSRAAKSPPPSIAVVEHENPTRLNVIEPSVPLTREVLQQHTRKWELESRNLWKKRLNLKRTAQQADLVVPISAKIFCDTDYGSDDQEIARRSVLTCPKSGQCDSNNRSPPVAQKVYHTSFRYNASPQPGCNFEITSVPLPPPLPVDDHQSAFSNILPDTKSSNSFNRAFHQPLNLSVKATMPYLASINTECRLKQLSETNHQSVIQNFGKIGGSLSNSKANPALSNSQPSVSSANIQIIDKGSIANRLQSPWLQQTCTQRLICLAQRVQKQQQQHQLSGELHGESLTVVADDKLITNQPISIHRSVLS